MTKGTRVEARGYDHATASRGPGRGRGEGAREALRARLGGAALVAAGMLFFLYPAFRPWHDETTLTGAMASMTSFAWVVSHSFAMLGFILVPFGLLALRVVVRDTRGEGAAFAAVVVFWIGAGLTLPYYGAETYGLHAIAVQAARGVALDPVALAAAVRFTPVAAVTFVLGLALLGAGAVLAAVAVARSAILPRLGAILTAVGFCLFIPQFFLPAVLRIAHGALVAAGAAGLGVAILRHATRGDGPCSTS